MNQSPLSMYGLLIQVNPLLDNVPRMRVSARFAELMPPEFVADLNAWMLEFFGTESVVYRTPGGRVVMGEKAYRVLLEASR